MRVTQPTTAPEEWRQWQRRGVRQAIVDIWGSQGPPLWLSHQQVVQQVQDYVFERSQKRPCERTIRTVINGR